jgi:hypothetical protein
MIPKSGNRFSDKIMLKTNNQDEERVSSMGTVSCKSEMPTTAGMQMIATQAASLPANRP